MRCRASLLVVAALLVVGCGRSKIAAPRPNDASPDGQSSGDAAAVADGDVNGVAPNTVDAGLADVAESANRGASADSDVSGGQDGATDATDGAGGEASGDVGDEAVPAVTCGSPSCFGPAGPFLICLDGSILGPVCSGSCQYSFPPCPPVVCPPLSSCGNTCPHGRHVDAKGCETCQCFVLGDCGAHANPASCASVGHCKWLEAGCGPLALQKSGCFPVTDLDCNNIQTCSGGRQCVARTVNVCSGQDGGTCTSCDGGVCPSCDRSQRICY